MSSYDPLKNDQLDRLIRRALAESVADEEPPAHVWDRIQAQLTRPHRRPPMRWAGPVLQAALLALLVMLGSLPVWQERALEQLIATPSVASPTAPRALNETSPSEAFVGDSGAVLDAAEVELLREYSSHQTRVLIEQELRRRGPGIAVSAVDIPPHPNSLQAQARRLESSDVQPGGPPTYTPGPTWQ